MATRLPDDSIATARDLGFLDSFRKIRGSLGVKGGTFDLDDYYKFKVASNNTNVVLSLRNLDANANLRLLGTGGTSLAVSRKRGKKTDQIEKSLNAGDYYIQVSQDGRANTGYTLVASPQDAIPTPGGGGSGGGSGSGGGNGSTTFPPATSPSSDPGDRLTNAFNIGTLSGKTAYKETLSKTDAADLYRFTVSQGSTVRILTNDIQGGDATTTLIYDIRGNQVVDGQDVLASGSVINKALGAGTYFIGVQSQTLTADQLSYTLQLQQDAVTNLNPTSDPPLGLGGATDLGVITGSKEVRQTVSTSDSTNPALVGTFDSTDIYKFSLASEASNVSILLNSTQTTGNVTLSLIYDENGNGIANPGKIENGLVILGDFPGGVFTGSSEGGSALAIDKTLGAGTYYLAVTQRKVTDNTTYGLNLFVNDSISGLSAINEPNNSSIPTAYNIGTLNQNVSFKQFVGTTDSSDFYSFTLDRTRTIIIRYNGSPELVGIRFGQDADGNGFFNGEEDSNSNNILDADEDANNNGRLDQDVFKPSLVGNVVYSPLPPIFDQSAAFEDKIQAFLTKGQPVDIYAKLPAGKYVIQIDPQTVTTDLGDGLTRFGGANVLYNLSFLLDGA